MDERGHAVAGGAFGAVGLFFIRPASAGDIEVDPGRVACELPDEHGCSAGAGVAPAARLRAVP